MRSRARRIVLRAGSPPRLLAALALEYRILPSTVAVADVANYGLFSDASGGNTKATAGSSGINVPSRLSADGRYSVAISNSSNAVAGVTDSNASTDVFLYDRVSGSTELVSHTAASTMVAGNGWSSDATVSGDGRYVVYRSSAKNLVAGMVSVFENADNIFVYDRLTKANTLVSHAYNSFVTGASYTAESPLISKDGSRIVFSSESINLFSPFPPSLVNQDGRSSMSRQSYGYDMSTGIVSLIDHVAGNPLQLASGRSGVYDLSADGRFAVLEGAGSKVTSPPTTSPSSSTNIYRYDFITKSMTCVTKAVTGGFVGSNGFSYYPRISADGRWIAYSSAGNNLLTGYSGTGIQAYLYDSLNGTNTLISHAADTSTVGGNGTSLIGAVSADGGIVSFVSRASTIVNGFVKNNSAADYDVYVYDGNTKTPKLVTRAAGTVASSGNGTIDGTAHFFSDDGTRLVFASASTNLISGFVDNNGSWGPDVFLYDIPTDSLRLVSSRFESPVQTGNDYATGICLSADGNVILFNSRASDVIPGIADYNGDDDVFLLDLTTGKTTLATRQVGNPSLTPGGNSDWAQQSRDGRYVTFTSKGQNLVPGQVDPPNTNDVFITDRKTGTTLLVSRAAGSNSITGNGDSGIPAISGDGRYVAYASYATNLLAGFLDGNGGPIPGTGLATGTDVYLFDRVTGITQLVSHSAFDLLIGGNAVSGTGNTYEEYLLAINDDGRYVTYHSAATNLIDGFVDTNGTTTTQTGGSDIFLFDRVTGQNQLVSHAVGAPAVGGNGTSYGPGISGDGRFVTYWSDAETMVAGMPATAARQVFVCDRLLDTTQLVSHRFDSATLGSNGGSNKAGISRDGNYIVYHSASNQLINNQTDTNNQNDVYLYNRLTGQNVLVSHSAASSTAAGSQRSELGGRTGESSISADGRYVVFETDSDDIVPGWVDGNGDTQGYLDVFVFDRVTGANTLVSRSLAQAATGGNHTSINASISGDGRFVAFTSQASNLIAGYTNPYYINQQEIYIYDQKLGQVALASRDRSTPTVGGNLASSYPLVNANGSAILFLSAADNLVAGDFNVFTDAFQYITPPPTVTSMKVADGSGQRSVVRSLTVTFDQPVLFAGDPAAAFVVRRGSETVALSAAVTTGTDMTVTLTFSGPGTQFGSLVDGRYTLTVLSSQVQGIEALDGDADGLAGGDNVASFHRHFGDSNGDARVDSVDFLAFRLAFALNNPGFDYDGDGTVSPTDFLQFRLRFLQAV